MKKIFYLLMGILLLPTIAKAETLGHIYGESWASDCITIKYKAMFKGNDNKIPYGTIYEIEDETGGTICDDNDLCVKIEDLTAVLDEYKVDSKYLDEEESILVITDTNIKSGPGIAYKTIGYINKGETIKARHVNNTIEVKDCEDSICYAENPWYYVEYNNIKGYISTYRNSYYHEGNDTAFNIKNEELMAFEDIEIKSFDTNKVIKTIKAGTIFNAKLGVMWDDKYIEYDGVKGYIEGYQYIGYKEKLVVKPTEETYVYNVVSSDGDKMEEIATIKAGTVFETDYYVSNNNDPIYVYYEKDSIKGFVEVVDGTYHSKENITENEVIEDIIEKNINTSEINNDNKNEIKVEKPKKDYTLYICIGAGIVVALIVLVPIILINKKKNKEEL